MLFERENRLVPAGMDLEEVTGRPRRALAVEKIDTLFKAPAHLIGMAHRVDGPDIIRMMGDRGPSGLFGRLILSAFFQSEGLHAQQIAIEVMFWVPVRQGPCDTAPQIARFAEEEVELMADREGQNIARIEAEQLIQRAARPVPVSGNPLADGAEMECLTRVGRGQPLHKARGIYRVRIFARHQPQIGPQGLSHDTAWICRPRGFGLGHHLGLKGQEVANRPVIMGHSLFGARHQKAGLVFEHGPGP